METSFGLGPNGMHGATSSTPSSDREIATRPRSGESWTKLVQIESFGPPAAFRRAVVTPEGDAGAGENRATNEPLSGEQPVVKLNQAARVRARGAGPDPP